MVLAGPGLVYRRRNAALSAGVPMFHMLSATLIVTRGNDLVDGVQHAGEVRDDLTLEQILDMIVAIATIHGGTGYTEPILQTVLDGLRPPA